MSTVLVPETEQIINPYTMRDLDRLVCEYDPSGYTPDKNALYAMCSLGLSTALDQLDLRFIEEETSPEIGLIGEIQELIRDRLSWWSEAGKTLAVIGGTILRRFASVYFPNLQAQLRGYRVPCSVVRNLVVEGAQRYGVLSQSIIAPTFVSEGQVVEAFSMLAYFSGMEHRERGLMHPLTIAGLARYLDVPVAATLSPDEKYLFIDVFKNKEDKDGKGGIDSLFERIKQMSSSAEADGNEKVITVLEGSPELPTRTLMIDYRTWLMGGAIYRRAALEKSFKPPAPYISAPMRIYLSDHGIREKVEFLYQYSWEGKIERKALVNNAAGILGILASTQRDIEYTCEHSGDETLEKSLELLWSALNRICKHEIVNHITPVMGEIQMIMDVTNPYRVGRHLIAYGLKKIWETLRQVQKWTELFYRYSGGKASVEEAVWMDVYQKTLDEVVTLAPISVVQFSDVDDPDLIFQRAEGILRALLHVPISNTALEAREHKRDDAEIAVIATEVKEGTIDLILIDNLDGFPPNKIAEILGEESDGVTSTHEGKGIALVTCNRIMQILYGTQMFLTNGLPLEVLHALRDKGVDIPFDLDEFTGACVRFRIPYHKILKSP